MCGGVCDNMVRLSSYTGHFAVLHTGPSTLCPAGGLAAGTQWAGRRRPRLESPPAPGAVRRLCRPEPGTVPTGTALPVVNPGSHPVPAAATKLIVTGIHGASVAVALIRERIQSLHHMGVPPPLTPAPRGIHRPGGEGAAGSSPSVPSVDLFYFNDLLRFLLCFERGDKCGAGQAAAAETRLAVAGSLGRGQLACPCFLRPRPGPPQLGSAVPSHRPGTTACLTEAGRCVSGVLPLLQLFVGEPRGALSMWPKPRFGSQWGGETSAPAPASSAQPPGAQGLLRGLRKRHLPSARSCQVFFKGLQVSRDQTDVKISLESQIYP